jgi:hypothetical protein
MKKIQKGIITTVLTVCALTANAAQIDLGLTLGNTVNTAGNPVIANLAVGTFTGYTDATATAFFSGKDYATLLSSFVTVAETGSQTLTSSAGDFYGSFDLGLMATNTRLFALVSTQEATPSSFAFISGIISGTDAYSPMWLAPASAATDVNIVEMGTTFSRVYAGNAVLTASTAADPNGANIVLIPEPSSASLLALGVAGLVALRARRKS